MKEVSSPKQFTFCPICMENTLIFVDEDEDDFTNCISKTYECTKCHLQITDWYYHHETSFDLPEGVEFDESLYPGTEVIIKE